MDDLIKKGSVFLDDEERKFHEENVYADALKDSLTDIEIPIPLIMDKSDNIIDEPGWTLEREDRVDTIIKKIGIYNNDSDSENDDKKAGVMQKIE